MTVRDLTQGDGGEQARNVLGAPLEPCSFDPVTGFSATDTATHAHRTAGRTRMRCHDGRFPLVLGRMRERPSTPRPSSIFPASSPATDGACARAGWRPSRPDVPRRWCDATHEATLQIVPSVTSKARCLMVPGSADLRPSLQEGRRAGFRSSTRVAMKASSLKPISGESRE